MSESMEYLDLSVRARNALENFFLPVACNAEFLDGLTDAQLLRVPNLGKTSLAEIRLKLDHAGR
jgi:DNA-directed RNA polymerase alpha subunit